LHPVSIASAITDETRGSGCGGTGDARLTRPPRSPGLEFPMMDEQGTRFAVLLEDMGRKLSVVAESNQAVAATLADMKHDFNRRFDEIDVKLVGMTIEMRDLKAEVSRLGGKVDKLEEFAKDTAPRLERIETKLDSLTTRTVPSPPHRRKPAKRT
jgi:chromosome segregation ATPase